MKQLIFSNWNFMRVLRLVAGIAVIVQAIIVKDVFFGFVGLMVTIMAVFNTGCCGAGNCNVSPEKFNKTKRDIDYEEVV